ncbi:hypothetical protein [Enterococcus faecium]|uniref:hypothetical protein n=1 Tax=Enterococcus faecium TaxID=1352 RepID=UPI00383C0F52
MNEVNQNNQKINTASKRFKVVSASDKAKGRYLANWLLKKSYHLKKEIEQQGPKYFDQYKKGTIVMIDFGVNIGNELSNHHFGIVISKGDNKRNGILTVLPLSSKFSKHYLKLDDELFKTIVADFKKKVSEIKSEQIKLESMLKDTTALVNGVEKTITIENENGQEEVTNEITRIINYISQCQKEYKNKLIRFNKILNKYEKYNNDSYVCIKNIQTISKHRIITINEFDPSGTIRLSKSTMDRIDRELVKIYTDIKI